ncbi:hypothetical protein MLD38_005217 [Melastoma candidum]|uniref:Uncharacterized protein n=1 Tax=Melastoma candidum TaxID=119954 RepID=A0ACB9SC28_9MYRT|nr:hypothetical protein MLD38_005217 [Melastoma candidum]
MGGARPAALLVLTCLFLLQPLLWSPLGAVLMCHEEERSALLGFKKSFFNESHCLSDDGSRPRKMMTWKDEEGEAGDCCNWGGIKCEEDGGHVIGLDLSEGCLSGRIDTEASIFNLVHLEELSLAYNSFDGSPFPTALRRLTRLMRLNLSSTGFAGEVVPELTKLRNLSSLDLSRNGAMNASSLEELLQSLNKLEELDLTQVRVSDGIVPRSLGNMTSFRSLVLHGCGLSGRFPDSIFELPQLEYLDLSWNHGLMGRLTGFYRGSPIKTLRLSKTNFSGNLPVWLGNLSSLAEIDVNSCGFWGEIPSSMGDLTKLEYLNLASNNFRGRIPASFGNLISLSILDLHGNRLTGEIPSTLGNFISMVELDISINELTGQIPPSLGNLTQLQTLFLHSNQLSGEIPSALMKLPELLQLGLAFNMFTGNVPPEIGNLTELIFLGLANNMLHGQLPDSIFRLQNLNILNLRSNHLIGMPRFEKNVSEPTMWYLDLSFNDIEGMVPIPPYYVSFFLISNNRLSGEIPTSICLQNNIRVLDLSDTRLDGGLPWCFGNFSASLRALSLSGNNFSGQIPEFYQEQCGLITMDLSSNSFQGALPRSIANCPMLGYVNFGKNKILDTFPAWLGSLPSLKVLMLLTSFMG